MRFTIKPNGPSKHRILIEQWISVANIANFSMFVSVRDRAEVIITHACSELYACVRRGDTYYESGLRLC
jgi:hypothetical protein